MKLGFVRKLWKHPEATQIARLKEIGIQERQIWVEGRGAETAQEFVNACRDGYEVYVASDLRVFGTKMSEILGITSQLEKKHCVIHHTDHDKTLSEMIECAKVELGKYNRWKGSKKDARRIGAKGPKAKMEYYELKRAAVARDDVVQRLADHPKLAWKDVADILGPPFSIASLRRHYPRSNPRGKRK